MAYDDTDFEAFVLKLNQPSYLHVFDLYNNVPGLGIDEFMLFFK